ncbi:MAG: threonylcarbamoyl-AMP synthase, partial [Lachnospiraceae bacterium]|nr:threonylcarbamoyl-AMP synthase [Lachnospiraceae bacterium]
DMTQQPPQILRPGYVTRQMLEQVLGQVDIDATILSDNSGQAPRAPGMKYRHYAPRGEMCIVAGRQEQVISYINEQIVQDVSGGERVGVICTDETAQAYEGAVVKTAGSRGDEESIARHLYSILREFDDEQVTRIYSEDFAPDGLGQAIMNRLLKAAGHRRIEL